MDDSLFIIILATAVSIVDTAGINGQCSSNLDCIETNSNSFCKYAFTKASCGETGYCTCSPGYSGNQCAENKKGHGETCSVNTDCDIELTCNGAQCVCATSTFTYRTQVMRCISQSMKAYGESCTQASECFNDGQAGMTCSALTCKCSAGYLKKNGLCVLPHYGEECTGDAGCTKANAVLHRFDSSRQTETCQAGFCTCPSTAKLVKYGLGEEETEMACIRKNSGTLKSDGVSCDTGDECASKICSTCLDGTSDKKCVRTNSKASPRLHTTTLLLWSCFTLAYIFQ